MGFYHADDGIFTAAVAANALAQHAVGFADARSISEKDLEDPLSFFGSDFFQPLLRTFLHVHIVNRGKAFVENADKNLGRPDAFGVA